MALRKTVQGEINSLNSTCLGVTKGATATALLQMVQAAKMVGEALIACIDETDAWVKESVEQYGAGDNAAALGFAHTGSILQTLNTSGGEDG